MSLNILPNELIECISINLNYVDVCNLLQVNSRLNFYLSNCNGLWHRLFRKQWPLLYEEVFEEMENKSEIDWKFETMQCHLIGANVYKELEQMSGRYIQKEELSDSCFECFRSLAVENRQCCLIDELEIIVNGDNKKYNLTIKFYAAKALRFVRTELVRKKWTKMVQEFNYTLDETVQQADVAGDLISGSVLIAQYCQPNKSISETNIRRKIRDIALKAVKVVRDRNPKNSLISQRDGQLLSDFDASRLTNSILEHHECIEVVHAINVAMYEGPSPFRGNRFDYYSDTNSYIDKVLELKLGIPILLCVIYQAIAALLGVKLHPINNPGHFLLGICNPCVLKEKITYIDPFNDGTLSDQSISSISTRNLSLQPLIVFLRMVTNLVDVGRIGADMSILRNALELSSLIDEEDHQRQLSLVRVYLLLNINNERSLQILNGVDQQMQQDIITTFRHQVNKNMQASDPPIVPKYRTNVSDVEFAVGMKMRHRKLKYTCVICGWDEKCAALSKWIEKTGVKLLPKGENQPFYKVLVDDGSNRYAAQENLEIASNLNTVSVDHPEVGRYFTRFTGRYYELNEEMRAKFPDDERALEEIYLRHAND